MVEGGGEVITSFLQSRLADHLVLTHRAAICRRAAGPGPPGSGTSSFTDGFYHCCGPDIVFFATPRWHEVMKRYFLECVAPGRMEVQCSPMTGPGEHEVTVQTTVSAISPGTEMLVYRGQWPEGVSLDSSIEALTGSFSYPVAYGYCAVGKVVELGSGVSSDWIDRRVFAFQPHQSHFHAPISSLEIVPVRYRR